jgi:hypothetical protein
MMEKLMNHKSLLGTNHMDTRNASSRSHGSLLLLGVLVCACVFVGCGAPEAPEIDDSLAEEIAREDQAVLDAESDL